MLRRGNECISSVHVQIIAPCRIKTAALSAWGGHVDQGDGKTPNTNKGEGRCRDLNLLLNKICDIKRQLETRPDGSKFYPPLVLCFFSLNNFNQSSTSCSESLRSFEDFGAELRACLRILAKASEVMNSARASRASSCTR